MHTFLLASLLLTGQSDPRPFQWEIIVTNLNTKEAQTAKTYDDMSFKVGSFMCAVAVKPIKIFEASGVKTQFSEVECVRQFRGEVLVVTAFTQACSADLRPTSDAGLVHAGNNGQSVTILKVGPEKKMTTWAISTKCIK